MTTPRSRGRRVVISSVTGEPIPWDGDSPAEDAPEPGSDESDDDRDESDDRDGSDDRDESNDDRIQGDAPPHWGRGA